MTEYSPLHTAAIDHIYSTMLLTARPRPAPPAGKGGTRGVLSLDEVVAGDDYSDHPSPMKATTSAGYEYRHHGPGKTAFITTTEKGNVPTPLFREIIAEDIAQLEKGEVREHVTAIFLKDETRPVARKVKLLPNHPPHQFTTWKGEVLLPKRTRFVFNMGLVPIATLDMYLGPVLDALYHGSKFSLLYSNLLTHDFKRHLEHLTSLPGKMYSLDVENNDLTKQALIMHEHLAAINKAADVIMQSSPKEALARRAASYRFNNSKILIGRLLYQTTHVLQSGAWGTTKLGQLFNVSVLLAAVAQTLIDLGYPRLGIFDLIDNFLRFLIYGDDASVTLNGIPLLDVVTNCKTLGNVLTLDDKTPVALAKPLDPLDMILLKRTLAENGAGKLPRKVIHNILFWRWNNGFPNSTALPELAESALSEWFFHGAAVYGLYKKLYDEALRSMSLRATRWSFYDLAQRYG